MPAYDGELSMDSPSSQVMSDVQLTPVMGKVLLTAWLLSALAALGFVRSGGNPWLAVGIVGVPTFVGMVVKPSFALGVWMLVMPTGNTDVGESDMSGHALSLGRVVGIVVAISFVLNILLVSRARLNLDKRALCLFGAYWLWVSLAPLWSPYPTLELGATYSHVQRFTMLVLIVLILGTNDEKAFVWALRSYVVGCVAMLVWTTITGSAEQLAKHTYNERQAAVIGEQLQDANYYSAQLGLTFVTSLYLLMRDKHLVWRVFCIVSIPILAVALIKAGSRGAMIALAAAVMTPLLFIRQVARRPSVLIVIGLVGVLAVGAGFHQLRSRDMSRRIQDRLTESGQIHDAFVGRLSLCGQAIETALRYPMGTSRLGYLDRAGATHYPHSDLFYALGVYGFPGVILLTVVLVFTATRVRKIPEGMEKMLARSAFVFIFVMGFDISQLGRKYYWAFIAFILSAERIARLYSGDQDRSGALGYRDEDETAEPVYYHPQLPPVSLRPGTNSHR